MAPQVYDNPVLGMWAWKVRRDYRKKKLAQWKIDRLDAIEFLWDVDHQTSKWHTNLHEARRYKVNASRRPSTMCHVGQNIGHRTG